MYVHYYYYIIGVLRDATKSKELSRAKFKREGSGEFLRYLSLSFSRSLSLSLSALPWVSINLLNFLKGKRRGNVARCVACARDRHFWIETRETFFIPSSPSFLRPRIYYPVNELRSSSFFWQKIHLYACEERKRAYIYVCVWKKEDQWESARYRDPIWVHPIYRSHRSLHVTRNDAQTTLRLIVTIREIFNEGEEEYT